MMFTLLVATAFLPYSSNLGFDYEACHRLAFMSKELSDNYDFDRLLAMNVCPSSPELVELFFLTALFQLFFLK
jgi:hypothetical protein